MNDKKISRDLQCQFKVLLKTHFLPRTNSHSNFDLDAQLTRLSTLKEILGKCLNNACEFPQKIGVVLRMRPQRARSVPQQVWHDKHPSLLKGAEHSLNLVVLHQ